MQQNGGISPSRLHEAIPLLKMSVKNAFRNGFGSYSLGNPKARLGRRKGLTNSLLLSHIVYKDNSSLDISQP